MMKKIIGVMIRIKKIQIYIILLSFISIFSCDKYNSEDLLILEEATNLVLKLVNKEVDSRFVKASFEKKGYKCYINNQYDNFYLDTISKNNVYALIYQKSEDMVGGKTLDKMISVSENFKQYSISIHYDETKVDSMTSFSKTLYKMKIYKMGEFNMKYYNMPSQL